MMIDEGWRMNDASVPFSRPLKKGATAGLSSSVARNTREITAGQASGGAQTTGNGFFNGLLAAASTRREASLDVSTATLQTRKRPHYPLPTAHSTP
jgi:hypothetical protein